MLVKFSKIQLLVAATLLPGASLFSQTVPKIVFSAPHKVVFGSAATPSYVSPIVAGDVYGNGKTDLIARLYSNGVYQNVLLAGDGKGGFTEAKSSGIIVGDKNIMVDLNGDGHLDYLSTFGGMVDSSDPNCPETLQPTIYLLLGDGHGNFRQSDPDIGIQPYNSVGIVVRDFNGDGKPDLAILTGFYLPFADNCDFSDVLVVWLNNGDGSFTKGLQTVVDAPDGASLVTGDFNGDGHADLAFLASNNQVEVMYGDGNGGFHYGYSYQLDSTPNWLGAANMNGDKKTDLVVEADAKNAPTAHPRIATLLAKQSSGFYWASAVSVTNSEVGDLQPLVDLNGDGKLDIWTADYLSTTASNNNIEAFANQGDGRFVRSPQVVINNSDANFPMAVPLFTGGLPDIIYGSSAPSKVLSFEILFNESK